MKKIIGAALFSFMFLSRVVFAQESVQGEGETLPNAGITPGSPFFFVERLSENVGTFFTFGEKAKTHRFMNLAEERLAEAKALADKGSEESEKATELYEKQFAQASERAQKSQNTDALARVTEATSKHFAVLEEVAEKVPEQARASVQRALENSKQGQVSALQALSGVDPDRAVEAGANAAKELAVQVRTYAMERKTEAFEQRLRHFEGVFNSFTSVPQGRVDVAAKFSERMTEVVNELGEAKNEAENAGIDQREIGHLGDIKDIVINNQLSSLKDVARENPERAIEIFSRVAENRLQAVRENTNEQDGRAVLESLNDYNKYSEFGQQISTITEGVRTGGPQIGELVKQATSVHTQVLENVRQQLPPQAQQEFQRALDNSKRVQEQRPITSVPGQWEIQQFQIQQPGMQPGMQTETQTETQKGSQKGSGMPFQGQPGQPETRKQPDGQGQSQPGLQQRPWSEGQNQQGQQGPQQQEPQPQKEFQQPQPDQNWPQQGPVQNPTQTQQQNSQQLQGGQPPQFQQLQQPQFQQPIQQQQPQQQSRPQSQPQQFQQAPPPSGGGGLPGGGAPPPAF